jgi:hypothetical protein
MWILVIGSAPTTFLGGLAQKAPTPECLERQQHCVVEPEFYSEKLMGMPQPFNGSASNHIGLNTGNFFFLNIENTFT